MSHARPGGRVPLGSSIVAIGLVALTALISFATVPPSSADAQDSTGAELFAFNCSSCHHPKGKGGSGFSPPLAGNPAATDPDYVAETITNGKSGPLDVLGVFYDDEMPPVEDLSDDQLTALVAHVVNLALGVDQPDQPNQPVVPVTPDQPLPPAEPPVNGDVDRGHDLFVGSNRLDNGGAACASCHTAGEIGNLGGQSLGPDLTLVYQKLGGESSLTAWLANPASPTMRPVFRDQPMTEAEIADLVAFLADAPDQNRPNKDSDWLLLAGLGGLVILLGGMAIAWRGMRQTYVSTLRSRR